MTEFLANRSIRIEESAVGNIIASGDGNTIYVIQQTIEQRCEEGTVESKVADIGPNPYKGLATFKESDANHYFGREAQIERLWQRFQDLYDQSGRENAMPRLLPILGPSGCGKSSLARAGFIPELARRPLLGKKSLRVTVLVPGTQPLEALSGVLAKAATDDPLPVEKAQEFERVLNKTNEAGEYAGLRRITNLIPDIQDSPLVILVDQFEEIYSLCKDVRQRQAFINNLLHAASDPTCNVLVVITLRSDFWRETQRHEQLNQVIGSDQSVNVPAMTAVELRRAISEPAKQAGYPFEEATIDLLVKDTEGREGALPLLQFALTRIWEGLKNGKDPAATYREMKGVGGALAGKAQEIYDKLTEAEKKIAQRVFVGLVQLGEGTRDTRRRVMVDSLIAVRDVPETVDQIIRQFSSPGTRLITLSSLDGHEIAEVTHEALFEHWQQLNDWLDSSRDDIRFLRRLEAAAHHWHSKGKPSGLLWRTPDTDLLRDFKQKALSEITSLSTEFFEASDRTEKRERRLRFLGIAGLFAGLIMTTALSIFSGYKVHQAESRRMDLYVANAKNIDSTNSVDRLMNGLAAIGLGRSPFLKLPSFWRNDLVISAVLDRPNRLMQASYIASHLDAVYTVAISADGQTIVSGGADKTLRLWDQHGNPITELITGHSAVISSVAISKYGQTIASGTEDGTVQLWNRQGQPITKPFKGHSEWVSSIAISADGQTIATASHDRTVRLWNRQGQPISGPFEKFSEGIQTIAISADGQTIVTGSPIRLWNRQGQLITDSFEGHSGVVTSVAISADGQTIATASHDRTVRLWNRQGQPIAEPFEGHLDLVNSVAISADGQTIATASHDRTVRLWNRQGQPIAEPFEGHSDVIYTVAISADGQTVVSGSEDGTVQWWDQMGTSSPQPFRGHSGVITSIAVSADGQTIVSGGEDGSVRLWNRQGQLMTAPFEEHPDINSVAISADGQTIVSGSGDRTVRLWDRQGQLISAPFEGHTNWVYSVAIDADGQTIVSGDADGIIRLWNRQGQLITAPFEGHSGWVSSIAISADGQTIASGGGDGTVRLWNRQGQLITDPFEEHSEVVYSVAIDADGQTIVSGSRDGTVRLWDRQGQLITAPLKGHSGWISSVAISADGKIIVSGSEDGARLWNRQGQLITDPFEGHLDVVTSVAISADGQTIVSGSEDKTIHLLPPVDWVTYTCNRLRGYIVVRSQTNNTLAGEVARTCNQYAWE